MEDKVDNKRKAIVAPKDDNGHNQDLPVPPRKVKVLIVDNDPRTLRIHKNLLKSLGVEIRTVKDGREAINMTAWNDYSLPPYDLILIGRHLPFRNGIKVTKTLRAIRYPSRIVGVTRSLTEAQWEEFMSAGVDDIVDYEKPMSLETIKMLLAATPRPGVWRENVIYDAHVSGN
ncbi:unnamed protein product [Lathyrus sativus]|nr:unnamed protein product [Lathyrus sativus]